MARLAVPRLGKYELLHRLAIGGMGEVFLAREHGLAGVRRLVVLKRLLPELAEDPHEVALFTDEARVSAHLAHPNIVSILDFGHEGDEYFLVMEFVPGENLARLGERAARSGIGLRRDLAVHIVAEVARALDYAHHATDAAGKPLGVIHRDISPHNILVSREGDVKLLDFGIAASASRRQRTRTGVVRGKLSYMSPEQIANGVVDQRSDLFSLGTVLWEMTLMQRLFAGDSEADTVRLVEEGVVPRPSEVDPRYPSDLEAVVMTALARNKEDRFQNAAALESALRTRLKGPAHDIRQDLGGWVNTLAPEKPEVAEGRRTTMPAGPAATPPGEDEVAEAITAGPGPEKQGMHIAWLVGLAVVAAGASLAWWKTSAPTGEATRAPLLASAEDAGSLDAGAEPSDAMAPSDATVAASKPPDAGTAVPAPSRVRKTATRARAKDAGTVAATPKEPAPAEPDLRPTVASPPAPGQLRVQSDPYGLVRIDNKSEGRTPLVKRLPPGRYPVSLRIPSTGRELRTHAQIESGRKTKCTVIKDALQCR